MSVLPAGVPDIDIDELARLHGEALVLLDVRQPYEYEAGHVPGAILVPMNQIIARVEEVPTDRPVYVVCETGSRSLKASQYYRSRGIDAHNVAGGTKAWIDSNRPVAYGPEPSDPSSGGA